MPGTKSAPGISFVPSHHPDELFYSLISHMQLYNAIPNAKTALKLLLGSRCVIPSIDLPTHLNYFQQNLGAFSPFIDVNELIENATLYPYYRTFLSPIRNELIASKLGNTDGNGLKTTAGIVANRFGASVKLKSCPECTANDIAIYGTPYWCIFQRNPPLIPDETRHRFQLKPYHRFQTKPAKLNNNTCYASLR